MKDLFGEETIKTITIVFKQPHKKLNAHNLGIYTLEDVFSEVEE